MGKFEEYINSLEGKENIDPLVVASTLHELHSEEIGLREAKIETLNSTIAEKDSTLTEKLTELTQQKAKNLDLLMQIPAEPLNNDDGSDEEHRDIDIDDLFERK